MIYVVEVVICSVETRSLLWATGSSVVFLFTLNFLFTDPKFTFRIDDANYAISLAIFIIVAFIVASLTVKLQRQMDIANLRADITARLNEIGSGFLNISGIQALVEYSTAEWCYKNSMECGHGKSQFEEAGNLYLPIRNSSRTYGVIVFGCMDGDLEEEERVYVDTVINQITIVLQREQMGEEKEAARLQIEKERLKSTLLRSVSYDLRTPLTGIAGSANFLRDNCELVDRETTTSMLRDICNDAEWLNSMVENLLLCQQSRPDPAGSWAARHRRDGSTGASAP